MLHMVAAMVLFAIYAFTVPVAGYVWIFVIAYNFLLVFTLTPLAWRTSKELAEGGLFREDFSLLNRVSASSPMSSTTDGTQDKPVIFEMTSRWTRVSFIV